MPVLVIDLDRFQAALPNGKTRADERKAVVGAVETFPGAPTTTTALLQRAFPNVSGQDMRRALPALKGLGWLIETPAMLTGQPATKILFVESGKRHPLEAMLATRTHGVQTQDPTLLTLALQEIRHRRWTELGARIQDARARVAVARNPGL